MSALRTIFGPALLAMVLVGVLAYLLSGEDDEYLDDPPAPVAAAAPEPAPAEPPALAPQPREPAPVAPPPVAPAAPPPAEPAPPPAEPEPAPPAQPEGAFPENPFVSDAAVPPPLPDKLRDHTMKLVNPAINIAMEKKDLKQLKLLRFFFEQRKRENLLPLREVQALDLAIACVEQPGPDARDEAHYYLTHGAKSQFAEGLRKACTP